ncbi:MAG: YhcH/YjgK/YiaL family protein [Clostridia bacterium]|nr:YhcH/YjgK/YiaL family protein [Clostridia bacterium]
MILSKLHSNDNLQTYPKAVQRALEYLKQHDIRKMEKGKHLIEGEALYVNVMDMTPRNFEGSFPEVHRQYIDLMYWPEGAERIGVAPFLGTEKVVKEDASADYQLLENVENENFIVATADSFALFFPWDAHRPCLKVGEETATVRKCVIKISMDLL